MSRSLNEVKLIGNLGQDPEVRAMPNGNAVANITLATSESWKDRETGQPQERTEWHRVVFFGKLAEIVGQYLKKGSKVYVQGALRTRKWQDQSGQDRYSTEIVVDMKGDMIMLDSPNGGSQQGNYQQGDQQQAPQPRQAPQGQQRQQAPQPRQAPQGQQRQQAPQPRQAPQQGGYQQPAPAGGYADFNPEFDPELGF